MSTQTAPELRSKCAWCDGSGDWTVAPGNIASCVVCGGRGSVNAGSPAIACRICDGRGRTSPVVPCFKCSGTGWESYPAKE